jgi:predicted PurR-regulated permease PerM
MTAQQRAWSWGIGLAVFLVLLYLLRGVMLPFVAGMAVAYFLDPACDWLEAKGSSRLFATSVITAGFFLVALLLLVLTAPLLYAQLVALLQNLPTFFREIVEKIRPLLDALGPYLNIDSTNIGDKMSAYVADALKWVARILLGVLAQLEALANLLSLLIITPIVSFYLLHDWDHIVARVDKLLPRAHAETIRQQLRLIDETLAGFLRGQVTVCLILGAFYGIALSIVGLPFGFVIGLVTGLISFVPFFGMLLGFVVGMAVAIASFDTMLPVGIVAGIFAVGQVIEGNFLTPKMVGERVGLHPVWVIFGLLAGGALFGFIGVLLAVPMAAVIGVLVRFAVGRYLESPLYLHGAPAGEQEPDREDEDGGK